MNRGKVNIITLMTLVAAALTATVASAGELESISTPDLCGRDRNSAYRMLERMTDELDTINHATLAYQIKTENSQAALEYWKKRQNSPIERILLGPDTEESLQEKITIAAALKEHDEQKKTRLANRAQAMRQQLSALEKALNADECPWASKKQKQHISVEFAAGTPAGIAADTAQSGALAQRAQ